MTVIAAPLPGAVDIWIAPLPAGGTASLSDRAVTAGRRRAAARAALDAVVGTYVPGARVSRRSGRRPEVLGSRLRVSLARAETIVLAAVTTQRDIGIDVEPLAAAPPAAVIAQLLSADEARALDDLPASERDAAFARAWVRKEAALKAVGVGIAVEPARVETGIEPDPARIVTVPGAGDVTVVDVDVPGHAAAVAVRGTAAITVRRRT